MSETTVIPAPGVRSAAAGRRAWPAATILQWALLALIAAMTLVPLCSLVVGAFSLSRLPNDFSFANMGLDNFRAVWVDQRIGLVLWNTVLFVSGSTFLGILIAAILAWLVERTDLPGKIWVYAGVPLALAVPGVLHSIAWVLLTSPRSGFINRGWMNLTGGDTPLFNIYTMPGLILTEAVRLVPVAFLMLVPLLRSMDPALEEAASTSGAGPGRTVRRVTLQLMLPGLIAITIFQGISALDSFEVPGILGLPADIHVFSTRVYNIISNIGTIPAFGQANALALLYLVVAFVVSFFYLRLVRRSERYSVITGKGYTPRLIRLGGWRYVAVAGVALFLIVTILLPFLVLLFVSLVNFMRQPSLEAFATFSFQHYTDFFGQPRLRRVVWNTLLLTLLTATVVTVLSFLVAYVVVRTRFAARYILDLLSFLPHSIPGIVLGLAVFWALLQLDALVGTKTFGSIGSLVLAFTVLFLSYSVRAMSVAMIQVHADLEDAAKLSGATPFRTAWRIFFPLLLPTLTGVWIYVALLSVRMVSVPLILSQGSRNEVLGVMIWRLWDNGHANTVGAIGVVLMVFVFLLALSLRVIGFAGERSLGNGKK
jgi:iron(III) transport system permease protein